MILGRFKKVSFGDPTNPADPDYDPLATVTPGAVWQPPASTPSPTSGSGMSTTPVALNTNPQAAVGMLVGGIAAIDLLFYGLAGYAAYSLLKK